MRMYEMEVSWCDWSMRKRILQRHRGLGGSNIAFLEILFYELVLFDLFLWCQIVTFERFWFKAFFHLDFVIPRPFFRESICLFFVEDVQIFVVFLGYQFLYWYSFLLLVLFCCQLCGDVCPGIYPDFFGFHAFH